MILDCNGFSIVGPSESPPSTTTGIFVKGNTNVKIKNCNVEGKFGKGIEVTGATAGPANLKIESTTITNNDVAIQCDQLGVSLSLEKVLAQDNGSGILVNGNNVMLDIDNVYFCNAGDIIDKSKVVSCPEVNASGLIFGSFGDECSIVEDDAQIVPCTMILMLSKLLLQMNLGND